VSLLLRMAVNRESVFFAGDYGLLAWSKKYWQINVRDQLLNSSITRVIS